MSPEQEQRARDLAREITFPSPKKLSEKLEQAILGLGKSGTWSMDIIAVEPHWILSEVRKLEDEHAAMTELLAQRRTFWGWIKEGFR